VSLLETDGRAVRKDGDPVAICACRADGTSRMALELVGGERAACVSVPGSSTGCVARGTIASFGGARGRVGSSRFRHNIVTPADDQTARLL
jgi:hypothetical protein